MTPSANSCRKRKRKGARAPGALHDGIKSDKVAGEADNDGPDDEYDEGVNFTGLIRTLSLRNCGHCFGDRAALTLAHLGDPEAGPGLESLVLTGTPLLADMQ